MRSIRWVPMVVAIALALAACSNGADDDGVASLSGDQAAGGASPSPSMSDEEAAQAFAECMRDHGIEAFPDPEVDADGGGIQFVAGAGEGGEPPDAGERQELDEAMQACEDLLPEGTGPDSISAEEEAAFQDAFLQYAQCMRDHGIDMPDPDFSEGGVSINGGDADPTSEAFQEADEACKHFLGDIGIDQEEAPDE
jgi:hypothetical protein